MYISADFQRIRGSVLLIRANKNRAIHVEENL